MKALDLKKEKIQRPELPFSSLGGKSGLVTR